MKTLKHLFERNLEWATSVTRRDPEYFAKLLKQQSPQYLWIGCSDSRVPANQIVNLPPGALFVHRNIANLVVLTDLNCQSVIQYAVEQLNVKHIIVCGHYGCGGVEAAMQQKEYGLMDGWLRHINDVSSLNVEKLKGLGIGKKFDLLCELNVKEQVKNVSNAPVVKKTWKEGVDLSIHGLIYNIKNGILKDLDICITSDKQVFSNDKIVNYCQVVFFVLVKLILFSISHFSTLNFLEQYS